MYSYTCNFMDFMAYFFEKLNPLNFGRFSIFIELLKTHIPSIYFWPFITPIINLSKIREVGYTCQAVCLRLSGSESPSASQFVVIPISNLHSCTSNRARTIPATLQAYLSIHCVHTHTHTRHGTRVEVKRQLSCGLSWGWNSGGQPWEQVRLSHLSGRLKS